MVEIDWNTESGPLDMYTQCPDCGTAFRVTADVLKQAAGKVRCGGCRNAFNALDYLSEQMPSQPALKQTEAALPELTPEIIETDNALPKSIAAEQSAALLKTLDELAGSDIRIEDTGVEWRVFDKKETAEPAADDADAGAIDDPDEIAASVDAVLGDTPIDVVLDNNPTPIDEFLTASPAVVDVPEIFETAGDERAESPVGQLRFDDDTPLPDDFDIDEESSYGVNADSDPQPEDDADTGKVDAPLAEIALSEPDEWTDILDEFEDLIEEVAATVDPAVEADVTSDESANEEVEAEIDADDPLDMDTQFALQAEAMGIDLSGINEFDEEPEGADGVVRHMG